MDIRELKAKARKELNELANKHEKALLKHYKELDNGNEDFRGQKRLYEIMHQQARITDILRWLELQEKKERRKRK